MSDRKSQIQNSNSKSSNVKARAYAFSLAIIQFLNNSSFNKNFWIINNQLLKSSTSIGANLIEAQASSSKREFIKFYEIALKSSNETTYWLSLINDSYNVDCLKLLSESKEICKMLGASVLTLKGKKKF